MYLTSCLLPTSLCYNVNSVYGSINRYVYLIKLYLLTGNRLLVFTRYSGPQGENNVSVEEYKSGDETTKVLWSKDDCAFSINDVCGSCAVIDTMPPLKNEFSPYLKRTLANYEACYPN